MAVLKITIIDFSSFGCFLVGENNAYTYMSRSFFVGLRERERLTGEIINIYRKIMWTDIVLYTYRFTPDTVLTISRSLCFWLGLFACLFACMYVCQQK